MWRAENAQLLDRSARTEQGDLATQQSQDSTITYLQEKVGELTKKMTLGEIRSEQLAEEVRAKSEAGVAVALERYAFQADLLDERKKTKDLTKRLDDLNKTVTKLNESIVRPRGRGGGWNLPLVSSLCSLMSHRALHFCADQEGPTH